MVFPKGKKGEYFFCIPKYNIGGIHESKRLWDTADITIIKKRINQFQQAHQRQKNDTQ